MTHQRFVDAAPEAYAALGLVLDELGGESARILEIQARQALVVREVPGRMIDLEVPVGSPLSGCGDGPLPVRAIVSRHGDQLVGELLVWVRDGRLIGIEQAWYTDEPLERWPSGGDLTFG